MIDIPTLGFLRDQLRRARQTRGLSQEELGRLINYSSSAVSAVELGHHHLNPDYLGRVDTVLETGGLFVSLLELIRLHAAPDWFRPWEEVEREATALRWYDPTVIPGLLQTETYARAMLRAGPLLTDDEVDKRVLARMARQAVLTRDEPPQLVAVLDEQALRRQVGDRATMREQLEHLLTIGGTPHVQVRIVPAETPWHVGLAGPFVLARLADGTEVAHLDNQLRGHTVDGPNDLATLGRRWETVAGEALPRRQSARLIEEVAKTWT
ncbi:helix-turn-helix domain-containing protein [Micromonospora endolithica]|uniref:XRE family transcriptional regulator n=1 Tax=Micromonospora endolithica TaxID=230091 RepID=A0A3A9Z889_9ACTN|nr:helix-turn-helix transcriptional regulator [Micromonospora endolithica]RKN44428.1 XRE family transcriptional regulator [Micromonospora endolithica]TWJ25923.1 helix-turn-helix protein [Micromonospora endolithica]